MRPVLRKYEGTFSWRASKLLGLANRDDGDESKTPHQQAPKGETSMRTFLHDLRYGVRILARNPGFAVAAILCLTLGIGATTAIFSVVNAVLLRPLPYAHPERLVKVYSEFGNFPGGGLRRFWVSPPEYLDLKRDTKSWESMDGSTAALTWLAKPIRYGPRRRSSPADYCKLWAQLRAWAAW
jgi:hypothetical protein